MPASIILVDDQPMFRQGLRLLVEKETDLRVVAEVDDAHMAVDIIRRQRPHLVIMGMNTQNPDGIDVTR